jgi:hypothetical protein
MGQGIIKGLVGGLDEVAGKLTDKRQQSNAQKYKITDAIKSAVAVFYFQHPSMLNFQQEMERKRRRSNLETLFDVRNIPCTEQIKNIVDDISPSSLEGAFEAAHAIADEHAILKTYYELGNAPLIALDGVWYFSSKEIHCEHCLSMDKKDRDGNVETTYYHDMVAATIVRTSPCIDKN